MPYLSGCSMLSGSYRQDSCAFAFGVVSVGGRCGIGRREVVIVPLRIAPLAAAHPTTCSRYTDTDPVTAMLAHTGTD
eukprot:3050220-Rhodomonas_salina.1